jgi:hypothetical protein
MGANCSQDIYVRSEEELDNWIEAFSLYSISTELSEDFVVGA